MSNFTTCAAWGVIATPSIGTRSLRWLPLVLITLLPGCPDGHEPVCHNGEDCNWVFVSGSGELGGCAIRADGSAWCWGDNDSGELGDGTKTDRQRPVRVQGISDVAGISCGHSHVCAWLEDGTLWCWGSNGDGRLGDGTTETRLVPVNIPMQAAVVSVHLHYVSSFALLADGTVWRWGGGFTTVPEQFEEIDDVVALADKGGCAIKGDGTAWCWGGNGYGQLGDGSGLSSNTPVQVLGLSGVVEVDQGYNYACAVTGAREAWCWGSNYGGKLGDGTTEDASAPVRVALDDVVSISAGFFHTCAITGDGSVSCFGDGYLGVWENGDFAETLLPVRVDNLQDVVQVHVINGSPSRTLAITADGTAWGWGDVSYGMLPLDVPDYWVIPDQSDPNRFWVWQPYPLVDP